MKICTFEVSENETEHNRNRIETCFETETKTETWTV